jgi:hypothetical protein
MLESWVCVRYRHCERDAVDIGDGAPSVARHPGLFQLFVCLRHFAERTWSELDAMFAKCCLAETRRRAVLFDMARASGVQTSRHVSVCAFPSSFLLLPPRTSVRFAIVL